jgi:hypothetical protein
MEKFIEKHLLESNCDAIEEVGYTRRFTPEELTERKEELADKSVQLSDIEAEKKAASDTFKEREKPLLKRKTELLQQLKDKSEYVREDCYKFIDHDGRMVGFYNSDGELVSSRAIMPQEMQKTIFGQLRTGTDN